MIFIFYTLSSIAIVSALLAVRLKNLIHAGLSLLVFFSSLAGLYLTLFAEFIAAVQILIYVGAVGVLVLFAIMLTRNVTGDSGERILSRGWIWGVVAALATFAWILTSIKGAGFELNRTEWIPKVADIGKVLMEKYLVSLEVIALLLTAALIGAVVIAIEDVKSKDNETPKN
jgi:NADH-quinone oxidoreductase subunit J